MTLWLEIPAMLGGKTDAELNEMRDKSIAHFNRFARIAGPAATKECVDAGRMIEKIRQELEIRRKARALMQ
jgi:hypothetical protein